MIKQTKPNKIRRDVDLLFEVSNFRNIDRVWKQFLNPDAANVAEHTFRMTWIAMTIAKYEQGADINKIVKMALMHDISESRCGDVHYLSRQYVVRREDEAMKDIFHGTSLEKEILDLSKEYEERKTLESKIVKDADNLDVHLELKEFAAKGHSLGTVWNKSRNVFVYPRLFTPTARRLWDEISKADIHGWHHFSKNNRYYGGDWKKGQNNSKHRKK